METKAAFALTLYSSLAERGSKNLYRVEKASWKIKITVMFTCLTYELYPCNPSAVDYTKCSGKARQTNIKINKQ